MEYLALISGFVSPLNDLNKELVQGTETCLVSMAPSLGTESVMHFVPCESLLK